MIYIEHNNVAYEIEVALCKPADAIGIVDADLRIEFLPPKDYNKKQPKFVAKEPATKEVAKAHEKIAYTKAPEKAKEEVREVCGFACCVEV